jgi:hypothetical protein
MRPYLKKIGQVEWLKVKALSSNPNNKKNGYLENTLYIWKFKKVYFLNDPEYLS